MNALHKPALALLLSTPLLWTACGSPAESSSVVFVDESDALSRDSAGRLANPLILAVAINSEGQLSLNGIETGTIDDTTILSEKLRTVFEDREKASIDERGVFVEMNGVVKHADVERLIETLSRADVSPIHLIKK